MIHCYYLWRSSTLSPVCFSFLVIVWSSLSPSLSNPTYPCSMFLFRSIPLSRIPSLSRFLPACFLTCSFLSLLSFQESVTHSWHCAPSVVTHAPVNWRKRIEKVCVTNNKNNKCGETELFRIPAETETTTGQGCERKQEIFRIFKNHREEIINWPEKRLVRKREKERQYQNIRMLLLVTYHQVTFEGWG
jgi:hypothetical protein